MSLCFCVMCDCWKKGKTKKTELDKYIVQEPCDLELVLPPQITANKVLAARYTAKFHEWKSSVCEHDLWKAHYKFKTLPFILDDFGGKEEFPCLYYNFYENHTDVIPMEMNKQFEEEITKLFIKSGSKHTEEYEDFLDLLKTSNETGNPICFC